MHCPTLRTKKGSWRNIAFTLKTPAQRKMSEMASLEKSRNSLQTGGWRRASFHASLWPESGHADLVSEVDTLGNDWIRLKHLAGLVCK